MSNGPTTARLGTPNMTPIVVGGPSASASAKGGAFELLLQLAKWGINLAGSAVQANKAKNALKKLDARIAKDRRASPEKGVLVSLQFTVMTDARGGAVAHHYSGYLYGRGATLDEARLDQHVRGIVREGTRVNEKYGYQPVWYPPLKPSGIKGLARPFPVVALACFVTGKAQLQNVKWTTVQGFDDEGLRKPTLPGAANGYRFDILKPPRSIVTSHGATGPVKLPILRRPVGSGGSSIEVVDLDTKYRRINLFHVSAAMVFPADEYTAGAFAKLPATEQKPWGTIRGIINFDRIRWVRPENICVLKSP